MLSPKQEAFCLHFAKTGNAAESYRAAGYTASTAGSAGAGGRRLLQKVNIQNRLKEIAAEINSHKVADAREIQERLTAILRAEEGEEVVVTEGVGDGMSEARVITKKAQLKDIIKAGEVLARMQGCLEVKAQVELVVPTVLTGEDDLED